MPFTSPPTFVGVGAIAQGVAAVTPALPAGIAAGNLLLLPFETANQAISIATQNGGNWAQVANSPQGTGTAGDVAATRLTLFADIYDGTQTAPVSSDSGDHNIGRQHAFACNGTTPYNVIGYGVQATASTSYVMDIGSSTVNGSLIVVFAVRANDLGTAQFSAPACAALTGIAERADSGGTGGNGGGIVSWTGIAATAGDLGNFTATCATASTYGWIALELPPVEYDGFSGSPLSDAVAAGFNGTSGYNCATDLIVQDPLTDEWLMILFPSSNTMALWHSTDKTTWTEISGTASTAHGIAVHDCKIDSNGKLHVTHILAGYEYYSRVALVRSGGAVTGWTWEATIATPDVPGTSIEPLRHVNVIPNGNGIERIMLTSTAGTGTWQMVACHTSLTATTTADIVSLSGVSNTWTPVGAANVGTDAPYFFVAHSLRYGTTGGAVVYGGIYGRFDVQDYNSSVVAVPLIPDGDNWTVGTPVDVSGNSDESFPGAGHTVNDCAYFPYSYRAGTADPIVRVCKIAADGTVTASLYPDITVTKGTELGTCLLVHPDERAILSVFPYEQDASSESEAIGNYWDGASWTRVSLAGTTPANTYYHPCCSGVFGGTQVICASPASNGNPTTARFAWLEIDGVGFGGTVAAFAGGPEAAAVVAVDTSNASAVAAVAGGPEVSANGSADTTNDCAASALAGGPEAAMAVTVDVSNASSVVAFAGGPEAAAVVVIDTLISSAVASVAGGPEASAACDIGEPSASQVTVAALAGGPEASCMLVSDTNLGATVAALAGGPSAVASYEVDTSIGSTVAALAGGPEAVVAVDADNQLGSSVVAFAGGPTAEASVLVGTVIGSTVAAFAGGPEAGFGCSATTANHSAVTAAIGGPVAAVALVVDQGAASEFTIFALAGGPEASAEAEAIGDNASTVSAVVGGPEASLAASVTTETTGTITAFAGGPEASIAATADTSNNGIVTAGAGAPTAEVFCSTVQAAASSATVAAFAGGPVATANILSAPELSDVVVPEERTRHIPVRLWQSPVAARGFVRTI